MLACPVHVCGWTIEVGCFLASAAGVSVINGEGGKTTGGKIYLAQILVFVWPSNKTENLKQMPQLLHKINTEIYKNISHQQENKGTFNMHWVNVFMLLAATRSHQKMASCAFMTPAD